MKYYLPININGRRLHYLNLSDKKDGHEPLYSFIVRTDVELVKLFSIDAEDVKLIAESGGSEANEKIINYSIRVEEETNSLTCFKFYIENIRNNSHKLQEKSNDGVIVSTGKIASDDPEKRCRVVFDVGINTRRKQKINEFIAEFIYQKNNIDYKDKIKIYLCEDERMFASCALDFGSEASQIRFDSNNANSSIVDILEGFTDGKNENLNGDYWQGKAHSRLYKSVYFLNSQPQQPVFFAERPKVGQLKNSFVQPLLKSSNEDYSNLVLLPNLKLMEIGANAETTIWRDSTQMSFKYGTNITGQGQGIDNKHLRNSIQQLILSNFLHCILKQECTYSDKYIRMVLLVPNVYFQSKISRLVEGLYSDYNTIQSDENLRYEHCKGFEVQVVSESDASFIGIKRNRMDIKDETGGLFLIIDAGKGTTDFSILRQGKNHSNFTSLYRDGIPASGNVLTYAFYEALRDFMFENGIDIEPMLSVLDNQKRNANLLNFTNYIESFKINPGNVDIDTPNSNDIRDLDSLNTYLKDQNNKRIPDPNKRIDKKIQDLTECIRHSLQSYLNPQKGSICFVHVLLSGRGFLYDPFKEAVIKMLEKENWIKNKDVVIRIEGEEAKSLCLTGALAIEKICTVNENSGLIGSPDLRKDESEASFIQKLKPLFSIKHKIKDLDLSFFYSGSDHLKARNIDVVIGGRVYKLNENSITDQQIYFIGDGFLCQSEDKCVKIEEMNYVPSDPKTMELLKETMFPEVDFNYNTGKKFPNNNKHTSMGNNQPVEKNTNTPTNIIDVDDIDNM